METTTDKKHEEGRPQDEEPPVRVVKTASPQESVSTAVAASAARGNDAPPSEVEEVKEAHL